MTAEDSTQARKLYTPKIAFPSPILYLPLGLTIHSFILLSCAVHSCHNEHSFSASTQHVQIAGSDSATPPSLIDSRHKKRVPLFSCGPSHVQASVKASLSRRVELLQARKTRGGSLPHTPISARFLQRRRGESRWEAGNEATRCASILPPGRLHHGHQHHIRAHAPLHSCIQNPLSHFASPRPACWLRGACKKDAPTRRADGRGSFFIVLHSVLRSCGTCDPRTLTRALFGVLSGLPTHHPGLSHMCTRRRPACPRRWTRMRWF